MTTLNRHTKKITLYQGDDAARIAELERAATVLAEESRRAMRRMNDPSELLAAATEYDDFVKEAAGRAVVVELNDIGRRKWRELTQAHPPREDNEDDSLVGGFNADTFPDALLLHPGSVAAIGEKRNPSAVEVEEFLDSLNHGDYQRLYSEAYLLNAGAGVDPKGSLVSKLIPRSDETQT